MGTNWKVSVVMMALRWNAARCRLAACLALASVIVACTGNPTQPPLTDLHLPGVRKIANLDALQRHSFIYDAAAYSPLGSSETRIIFAADQLYSMGLNGRDLRSIRGEKLCFGSLAPSPDGRWVACADDGGIELIALVPGASSRSVQLLSAAYRDTMWSPTWSPDGSAIALINRGPNAACKVVLYHLAADQMRTSLLATLTFPMFTGSSGKGCELASISWSRDAAWLALKAYDAARDPGLSIYVLSMANLSLFDRSAADGPVEVSFARGDLVRVGEAHHFTRIAWSNQGAHQLLTMVEQDLLSIAQIEPPAGIRTSVLKIPSTDNADVQNYGYVCSVAWTPDGAQLIFVDCAPGNLEVPAVPSKLYVYTPPAA